MKFYVIFISLFIVNQSSFGHSYDTLNSENERISYLCQFWGFLKYHHPAVAKGKLDWDQELVSMIPKVKNAETIEALSEIYQNLLNSLGPLKKCRKCSKIEEIPLWLRRNYDLDFINSPGSIALGINEKLERIRDNRFQGKNYYSNPKNKTSQADFRNEKPYLEIGFPGEEFRLLALFRFWNAVHYFYPYKYAIGDDWVEELTGLIPLFRDVSDSKSYYHALMQMMASIHDSHGFLTVPANGLNKNNYYLPVQAVFVEDDLVIKSFMDESLADKYNLRAGSIIKMIDGKPVKMLMEEGRQLIPASNEGAFKRDVIKYHLFLNEKSKSELTLMEDGQERTVMVDKITFRDFLNLLSHQPKDTGESKWLSDKIAYVNMGLLELNQVDSVMQVFHNASSIIFDLRNYPNNTGFVLSKFLVPEPREFMIITQPDFNFPGTFIQKKSPKTRYSKPKNLFREKVVILANEETQSGGETTYMLLNMAPNVITVGSHTAGANGDITWLPLPGGFKCAMSGLGIYNMDKSETQRVGHRPDILISPSILGIKENRDEVLEKALELIGL